MQKNKMKKKQELEGGDHRYQQGGVEECDSGKVDHHFHHAPNATTTAAAVRVAADAVAPPPQLGIGIGQTQQYKQDNYSRQQQQQQQQHQQYGAHLAYPPHYQYYNDQQQQPSAEGGHHDQYAYSYEYGSGYACAPEQYFEAFANPQCESVSSSSSSSANGATATATTTTTPTTSSNSNNTSTHCSTTRSTAILSGCGDAASRSTAGGGRWAVERDDGVACRLQDVVSSSSK